MGTCVPSFWLFVMRRILQFGILSALGAIFSVASAQASVLWWETNDPEDIEVENGDGTTTKAAALGVTDVRIRVSGNGAGNGTYLQMAFMDENGNVVVGNTPGTTVVAVPTYEVYAYLGPDGYNYDNAAYSFTIELGNWENGTWTVLAESDTAAYSDLAGHIASGGGGLDVPYALPWNPQDYHYFVPVPEPGTALLIVLGCAVLALRRRPVI